MPLRLKIPALADKPLIAAETRPQKITEFISNLPIHDPLEAATTLFEEMEILNRQQVSAEARVKALEVYRTTVYRLSELLSAKYCKASLPLTPEAKTMAGAAESLWLELGYGYKLALIDEQSKLFHLGSGKKTQAFMIQRALEALDQLAMVYYKTYFATPSSVWGDLNQLYLYAVQQGIHDLKIPTGADNKTTDINQTFIHSLLMSLAYPRHLAPVDIKRVDEYIQRHGHLAQLHDLGLLENHAGIFLVSLNSDNPPIAYSKNAKDPLGEGDVIMATLDLARMIHHHLKLLQAGEAIPEDELPLEAKDPRYQDLLTHLIKHWGASPKRIFNRSRKSDGIRLATGISAVHYFLNGERPYTAPATTENDESSTTVLENTATTDRTFFPSRWLVTNISAGGMALRKLADSNDSIKVGDLIGVKDEKAPNWAVGVVRWVSNDEQEQIDIGAHLIAPAAKAAAIRKADHQIFEKIILLPSIHTLKQSASMIAPSGFYSPARVLELDEDGKVARVMLTKLLERTTSFERFGFSYL